MSNRTLIAMVAALIVLLALPLISQAFKSMPSPQQDNATRNTRLPERTAEAVAAAAPLKPASRQPSVMTEMQFSQIAPGMTYAQCVEFIGSEGRPAGHDPGGGAKYSWQLVDGASGTASTREASLTFQNDILCGKGFNSTQGRRASQPMTMSSALPTQRPAAPPYVCRSVNDSIKDGFEYAECVRLLGVEGKYLGTSATSIGMRSADGTLSPVMADVYVWHNPSIQASLKLSFRDGKVMAREVSTGGMAAGNF